MVVALQEVNADGSKIVETEDRRYLARPVFNSYNPVSQAIVSRLDELLEANMPPRVLMCMSKYRVQYPTGLELRTEDSSLTILPRLEELGAATSSASGTEVPGAGTSGAGTSGAGTSGAGASDAGAHASEASAPRTDLGVRRRWNSAWSRFHIKGKKQPDAASSLPLAADKSGVHIVGVYLPLLAVVLPEWIRGIKRRQLSQPAEAPPPRKVLVIVSGAGEPRDEQANPEDNSTFGTGGIVERFVRLTHPDVEVVHIRSAYGIFRYDDNVRFVKEQVLPVIEARRAEVVAAHGERWPNQLKVTLSLADGAPARISALNAATRSYRPDYLHVWRTKTFWDTQMLSEEDVELHTFKKLEMRPATHRSSLSTDEEKGLVAEMVRYKRQFEAVCDSDGHELGTFWLRKTGKAVLAVLLTRRPDGELTYWRGLNVEVSMPTGSLCAERNAIGNALAADQSVHRRDMRAVAVLSVNLDRPNTNGSNHTHEDVALNPLDPCGACMEWLKKIAEVNPDFKVLTFSSTSCEKVFITPIGDYS